MNGYVFDVGCLHCGGELEHVADGVPRTLSGDRSVTQAIAGCVACRKPHRVTVQVVSQTTESRLLNELAGTTERGKR